MSAVVPLRGRVFDGVSDGLAGPVEILIGGERVAEIGPFARRPEGAEGIDRSDRTVSPGFMDTYVHLTMDAANLALQMLGQEDLKPTQLYTKVSIRLLKEIHAATHPGA